MADLTNISVEKKPVVHPGRGKLPDHLRREDIVIEPDHVPEGSIKIGELIIEQLECTQGELGMLAIDNNPVENSLRPVALDRKNYMFAGNHEAAQCTAMIYGLVGFLQDAMR